MNEENAVKAEYEKLKAWAEKVLAHFRSTPTSATTMALHAEGAALIKPSTTAAAADPLPPKKA